MIERTDDGYLVSAEDMQTLLIAARLGYAWSREEQETSPHNSPRVEQLNARTERIRSLVVEMENATDLPERKRMLRFKSPQIHPTRMAHSGDRYCAPENRSSRYSAA